MKVLPFENRLKKKKEFQAVLKEGTFIKGVFFFLKYRPNNMQVSRVGFIVSKKSIKSAAGRNKVKRRLRHIIKEDIKNIKTGYDLIFLIKKQAKEAKFADLENDVIQIIKRGGLYLNQTK